MRIALTGGIACGKSLVARYLNELGVETIDADDIVHELIPDPVERRRIAAEVFADPEKRKALEARLHPLVKKEINRRIVESCESSDRVNRRIGRIVESSNGGRGASLPINSFSQNACPRFDDSPHSPIRPFDDSTIRRFDDSTISPVAVIPLLFETHWDADYDIICCVRSARATQVARMTDTRGYTREEAEARLAAQMPVEEKAAKSHYVIDNDGSAEELKQKVAAFVGWLKREIVESCESSNR